MERIFSNSGKKGKSTFAHSADKCILCLSLHTNLYSKSREEGFNEPLDTAVFTTKFVLEESKDITYVTHEVEDGAWQFFSIDDFLNYEQVAKVVGLGEIIEIDDSVPEIADMPEGL